MQSLVLIGCSGQNDQLAPVAGLLPLLELIESVRPVTTSTQEPNNDQAARMARGAQVVIDLGGMAERGKRQGTDLLMPGLQLVLLQAAGQRGEVSGCTCQQQHWRGGLLDKRDGVPEITARQAAESVHSSILRQTRRRG